MISLTRAMMWRTWVSVGNGVTGLAMLSSGALVAVLGITAGAWLTLAWQMREPAQPQGVATAA